MDRPQRTSIRLHGYDYTRCGAYYITICTHGRLHVFGRIVDATVRLNALGDVVNECWHAIPSHFPYVTIDEFIIMPNHVHGVVIIGDHAGARDLAPATQTPPAPDHDTIMVPSNPEIGIQTRHRPRIIPGSLGAIVQGFKAGVTRQARKRGVPVPPTIWQRNYYEHIVRNAADHDRIAQYIAENPANWEGDRFR
jgi:REP element-mobilizing transposase RayT